MKSKHYGRLFVIVVVALFVAMGGLTSCEMLMDMLLGATESDPVTIEERITAFEEDLNVDSRDYIAEDHFHSSMESYDQLANATVLTTGPLGYANKPFEFSEPTIDDSGTDPVATVTFESFNADGTIEFTMMKNEDGDYMIKRLYLTVDGSDAEYDIYYYSVRGR